MELIRHLGFHNFFYKMLKIRENLLTMSLFLFFFFSDGLYLFISFI